jgi:hypothetical protein
LPRSARNDSNLKQLCVLCASVIKKVFVINQI